NQAALLHYQYTEQEFLEMKRTDLLTEDGKARFRDVLYTAKGKDKYNHIIQHRKKNGEIIDVQIHACLFQHADHDGVLVIAQDITDQKKAAFALQDSEARYKSLFEQNPEPVFSLCPDGFIQTANAAFAKLLGLSLDKVTGRSYYDFLEPECIISSRNCFTKVLQDSAQTFYSVIINKLKEKIVVNMTQMPIKVNNRIVGAFCILNDETEILKINQELKKSHQELRELASHIHVAREEERKYIAREIHDELGQVLTALKIDISLLTRKATTQQADISGEIASTLNIADEAIKSVKRIVSELRPMGLDDLGLLNEVQLYAQRYQTRFGIKVEVKAPKTLMLKREQAIEIFRIIQEALTNIARHSKASVVIIDIVKKPRSVTVSIADNGVGFNSEGEKKVNSFGLIGMRERALMIGGNLQ
ncbi:MAG: PAS domain S-box protein, partial [Sphingobacteriales bacterium]